MTGFDYGETEKKRKYEDVNEIKDKEGIDFEF